MRLLKDFKLEDAIEIRTLKTPLPFNLVDVKNFVQKFL